jgi:hypothetical protein
MIPIPIDKIAIITGLFDKYINKWMCLEDFEETICFI